MLEYENTLGYSEWDSNNFTIPKEYQLNENNRLHEALNVFYGAGGYDFFKVVNPKKYASAWLDFMSGLYSDIVSGKYQSDNSHHCIPLSDSQRASLAKQGVPEVFIKDL